MADLTKLYETRANRKQGDTDRSIQKAVDIAISSVLRRAGIETGFDEHYAEYSRKQTDEMMQSVGQLIPALEAGFAQAVQAILQSIANIEDQSELKRMIRSIRIPDYGMYLSNIEQRIADIKIPETDLKPIMAHMSAMMAKMNEEEPEEPKEWVFTVNRDEITKLIDTVEVTAK